MSRITQADVVRAAINQLSKRGGYTPDAFFAAKVGDENLDDPGANVGATCAIGGVEQAIWGLTGETVVTDGIFGSTRDRLAREANPALSGNETPRQKLYAGVMAKLNRKARALFPELEGMPITTVEGVTFIGAKATSRRRTLQVFNAVLDDLEKPKASA